MISFKHSGNCGDLIYSLPTVLSILKKSNADKATFYLELDQPAHYYNGASHPLKNVKLNKNFAEQLIPLLESQDYIEKALIYQGEKIDVDLDEFRSLEINQSTGHIPRWYFSTFLADYDLSKPWIHVDPDLRYCNTIVVNRTNRYRNLIIDYRFLLNYSNVCFLGLEKEANLFTQEVPIPVLPVPKDFLEMAKLIAGCKLFIGNQSFGFSLAEAIKTPRILEVCPYAPNVVPHGENAWDFQQQNAFQIMVHSFLGGF